MSEIDPASPCIKICQVNPQGICTGCGRSLDEIAAWPGATPRLRQQILQRARQRKPSSFTPPKNS